MANALAAMLPDGDLVLIGRRGDAAGLPEGVATRDRSARLPYPVWVEMASARDARRARADIVHYSDGIVPIVRHGRTVLAVHDLSAVRLWRSHPARRWARIPLVLASPLLADLILVPSLATADELIRFTRAPASRIEVIPYAPQRDIRPAAAGEIADVTARYGLQPHEYILVLGTIEPRKNHLRVIAAFERLADRRKIKDSIRLVIAGRPGWGASRVLEAIEASPVRDRIDRLGYVTGSDVSALMTGAGAAAYVSLYEGFGLPVVEAMACGAPTVTSNVSSMPEVAGDAAFLVDPFDTDGIARGLLDALTAGASDRAAIASGATARAARFSWTRSAALVVECYGRLRA
jgi:glycosyltransferase involved in cell wall biosynthesis